MNNYLETTNPFHLQPPTSGWLQALADYDADLVLFPSRKDYVYRLARRAHKSGGLTAQYFGKLPRLHPDTAVMFEYHLVPVTTIPVGAISAPPFNVIEQLKRRDQWKIGDGKDDAAADRIGDLLDGQDVAREAAVDVHNRAELGKRARAMRTSYLYRTGARVSLIRPPNRLTQVKRQLGSVETPDTTATGD